MEIDKKFIECKLSEAVKDVIGTMTGFEINEVAQGSEDNLNNTEEICGIMFILGKINAIFSLSMTRETAGIIIAYMTGIPPFELSEEDLYDGAAELVNMVAGRVKALLTDTEFHFNLTPPFAIVGKELSIIHKSRVTNILKKYKMQSVEMDLKVYYLDRG